MKCRVEKGRIEWSWRGEHVCMEACADECIRVRASFKSPVDKELNYNLEPEKDVFSRIFLEPQNQTAGQDQMVKTEQEVDRAILECGRMQAVANAFGQITFYYDGKQILKEEWIDETCDMPPYQKARDFQGAGGKSSRIRAYFHANSTEHLYGMGQENRDCLDLKGCTVDLCQKNTKCTIPFYISTLGYGFLWNNPAIGRAEFARNRFLWEAQMARQLDYVVVGGGSPCRIMEHYTALTGRCPKYPDWMFGLWQCKLRYQSQEEVLEIAREYKKRQIPLSVLVVDYFHWPFQGDWRFDERYFPEPQKMQEELEKDGIHLMVSVWPTVDTRSENYRQLQEEGCLITAEHGPDVFFMCRGAETYLDMTYPRAGELLFWELRENYISSGITSFWLDEAEPEIYPYAYENMRLAKGNGLEVSCYYPYAYNEGIESRLLEQGIWTEEADSESDGTILVRSGWIGSQRFRSVIWSGDVPSTFESFRRQLMAGLHMSMCGIVLWTTDIGGFYGGDAEDKEFRELMVRWFQFGVFCPILRMHGYRKPYELSGGMDDMSGQCNSGGGNELWSFGEDVYGIMLDYLSVREQLIPYIKEQLQVARETGTPLMRPLVYDFPEDEKVYDLGDEYMFGDQILAAPVMEYGARSRKVYLPGDGIWINGITGEKIPGNTEITAEAPLEKMPVFYRG